MIQITNMDYLSFRPENDFKNDFSYHALWQEHQQNQPKSSAASSHASSPEHPEFTGSCASDPMIQPADVLCGRGQQPHSHPGNKVFRKIILARREEYQMAPSREAKTTIASSIVAIIKNSGGRFLKQNEKTEQWEEVGDQYAREKVSHALRSAKDPNRPRVKKRREVQKHVPTPEEDALFELTLADQQRIFQALAEKEEQGLISEVNFEDTQALLENIPL